MDLQAIGIVLVSGSKKREAKPANEDQFYKDFTAGQRVVKMVELVTVGFTLLQIVFSHISPKRLRNRWKSTSQ